jgi:hypothetical protein
MNSLYQAYQSYERRVLRGELQDVAPEKIRAPRLTFRYRLGDRLVRLGMKLKYRAYAGHSLAGTARASK